MMCIANIEKRPRRNGRTAHLLRWLDKQTGERMSHRFDDEHEAWKMLMVLKAHDHDTERALDNVRKHYQAVYTVADMGRCPVLE